ncbi:hypothetical protein V500_09299 [Pseudogymnoascus sp. VKM F-4518 (FW-2643)]|nr:hypothetical protein V500_09299 [Pseudogymnoascus sp. VKM F-4518 (FW-2643)]
MSTIVGVRVVSAAAIRDIASNLDSIDRCTSHDANPPSRVPIFHVSTGPEHGRDNGEVEYMRTEAANELSAIAGA